MVIAEKAKELLTVHGRVRPQPPKDCEWKKVWKKGSGTNFFPFVERVASGAMSRASSFSRDEGPASY
jgi:hypothetical protein